MRLIDADAFADFIKNTIKVQKYDALKVNDTTLTVEDVMESVIAELEGTSLDGFKNNPTIGPKRIKGRWIQDSYYDEKYVCDKCGEPCATYVMGKPRDRFCKWCGADMRGDEE